MVFLGPDSYCLFSFENFERQANTDELTFVSWAKNQPFCERSHLLTKSPCKVKSSLKKLLLFGLFLVVLFGFVGIGLFLFVFLTKVQKKKKTNVKPKDRRGHRMSNKRSIFAANRTRPNFYSNVRL